MEVIIDGVKYLPADEVILNSRQIKIALLEEFVITSRLTDEEIKQYLNEVYVKVTDNVESDDYPTINEFVDNLNISGE